MKRVADQDQTCGFQSFGDGHGTHPTPHRATAEGDPADRDVESLGQFRGGRTDCLDAHGWWVRTALASSTAGKLDPLDHDSHSGDRLINCDQCRVVTSCSRTRSEYETSRLQSDHETIMSWVYPAELPFEATSPQSRHAPAPALPCPPLTRNDRPKAVERLHPHRKPSA